MPNVIRTAGLNKRLNDNRIELDEWGYPSGMVWCPMKMSGMALMKCAELQKQFGCGTLRQLRSISVAKPNRVPFFWPWLRGRRECPERANDQQIRELRLELTPLRLIEKSRKNPRTYQCPACGGRKAFAARQCPRCWHHSTKK